MAEPGSTLSDPPPPLKTTVEELGVLDQITRMGKQFNEEEKKQYFDSLPGKKYKVGLIRNKDLNVAIKIFTESFDFSKKSKLSGTSAFVSKECIVSEPASAKEPIPATAEEPVTAAAEGESVVTNKRAAENNESVASNETEGSNETNGNTSSNYTESSGNTGTTRGGGDSDTNSVDPHANVPKDADAPYEDTEELDSIPLNGFNRTGNTPEKELLVSPETIGTSSDFERLYLGWMNNPTLAFGEEDKQKRKNSMKSLFRFIFGTKVISDVTATTLQKKLRLAYTPLTHAEKLPCEDSMGGVWEDFRASLVYRRKLAMCELFAARDVLGGEQRLYIDRKKELILGLRDLIDVLDRKVYPCMLYAYDGSQHEEDVDVMDEKEYSRILKVFRTFVKDKKEGRDYYSLTNLKKELSKKGKSDETSQALYDELLTLLTWMAGEAEASARIAGLEKDLAKMKDVATEAKEDVSELEDLVLLLTVLLTMSEKIHKLRMALAELKCMVEKCCSHKRAEKLARAVQVKNADIETLEKEIQTTQEEYEVLVHKMQKTIGQQTDDIQDLEELVMALTNVLISIEKFHTLKMSLAELKAAVKACCDKKKLVDKYTTQLESMSKVLSTKDQNAQTLAAQSMVNQGLQFANSAGSELEKQIAELKARIEIVMKEDAKKAVRIGELEEEGVKKDAELAEKDVIIKELQEAMDALMAVIVGIKDLHDVEKNLAALKAALELCCERRKAARICKEKLELLEARIRELIKKEGMTKELETSLQQAQEGQAKAEEAAAGLKGQIDQLQAELEEVTVGSQAELESLRTELREEEDKDTEHAAGLASRIGELEAQILAAEAAIAEAHEGRARAEAGLAAAEGSLAAEKKAAANLRRNLNRAAATVAGYEAELADSKRVREEAEAAAVALAAAAEEDKKRAAAALAEAKRELEEARAAAEAAAASAQERLQRAMDLARAEAEAAAAGSAVRIAEAAAAAQEALAAAAAAENARAGVAANRNKLAANLRAAQEAQEASEAAREAAEAEKTKAERQLAAALVELGGTRANRNAARDALSSLTRKITEDAAAAEDKEKAMRAAIAATQAEAEVAVGASAAERDAIAAQLAERIAELQRLQGQQIAHDAAVANLQVANAELAAQLAAVKGKAAEAAAKHERDLVNLSGRAEEEKIALEDAAKRAMEAAVEEHDKRLAEITAAYKKKLADVQTQAKANRNQDAQTAMELLEEGVEREDALQAQIEELKRTSAALAADLAKAAADALAGREGAASQATQIDALERRIAQLQAEGLDKDRLISHLEGEAHELRAAGEKKSVWNRLSAPKSRVARGSTPPPAERPAWRSAAAPGQYTGRAAMGVSGASAGTTGASKVGERKFGGGRTASFCDTLLTFLLLELNQRPDFNAEAFMKKVGATLDDLGQCPLVLRALAEILDDTTKQEVPEEGFAFAQANVSNDMFAKQLEEAYKKNFTEEEKESLLHLAPPVLYYSGAPEEFEGILGSSPYFMNGAVEKGKDARLRGVDLDSDDDPIVMTGEERELVEKGGVPLGAILVLYLACRKDMEDDEDSALALR